MNIGIDARVLDRPMTGTGRFILNILNELPNRDKVNKYFLFSFKNHFPESKFYTHIQTPSPFLPDKIFSPVYLNFILPKLLQKSGIRVFLEPNVLIPLRGMKGIKTLSVVHDVIPVIFKELYPLSYRLYLGAFLARSMAKSDLVLTVSECSKADISKYCGIPAGKIEVIYNTASKAFRPLESNNNIGQLLRDMELPDKYLLFVGVFNKRKNIPALIKVMDEIRKQGSSLKLVMIGKGGYDYTNIYPEIERRKEFIKCYDSVSDETLNYLYNNSFAFVFPSLYEGFGIPVLEALQTGIPVVASNTSSLGEVAGEAGALFPPDDIDGFANAILKLERDRDYYTQLKSKALTQAAKFTIENTTEKLVGIINRFK